MEKWKLYQYGPCSTCKNALKFLENHSKLGVIETFDIKTHPPSPRELKKMLQFMNGEIKKLFNTSGLLYRELKLSQKLPKMTEEEGIQLLSANGMLIKRPFLLGKFAGTVGFKEAVWKKIF